MNNFLVYKIVFVVLFSILGIVILLPFACFCIISKCRNWNVCNNRIMNLPENNLPV